MRILPRRLRRRRPEERSHMPLLEHLEELRSRLIWVLGAVAIAGIAGWAVFDRVVDLLLDPARSELDLAGGRLIFTGPLEAFTLRFKVATYVGIAIASPVVLFHTWRFVSPGLHKKERRYAVPFIASGTILFAIGVSFAYFTLPQALTFLIGDPITGPNVTAALSAKQYLDFALLYHAAFGLAFELPVVLMMLTMTRVLNAKQLAKYRRHVFIGIAFASAILTPSVDWITMLVLTFAMYILYESCIWLSRLFRR